MGLSQLKSLKDIWNAFLIGCLSSPHIQIKEKHLISFHSSSWGQKILPWTYSVYRWQGMRFIWTDFVLSLCGFFLSTAECILSVPESLSLGYYYYYFFFVAVPEFITTHFWIVLMLQSLPVCKTIVTFTRVLGVKAMWGIVTWNG